MKYFESVALTHDLPACGLRAGDIGVIVEFHRGGEGYEVEFMTTDGRTVALLTLRPGDITPVGDSKRDEREHGGATLPHMEVPVLT